MELLLQRKIFTDKSTIGELFVDGVFECFTLEDVVRDDEKIKKVTAIPDGIYTVLVTWSPRFKRQLPLLIDVPGFDGIRIHPGNTDEDTDGCILVGNTRGKDFIGESRIAFDNLYKKLISTLHAKGAVSIEIQN